MKKYLFMCLAMICMAFSAVVLTSCGDDDEPKKANTIVMVPSTYDPDNQLTANQKSALDAIVAKAGKFSMEYDKEEEAKLPTQAWMQSLVHNIVGLMMTDPSILQANKAGIKVDITAEGRTETEYLTFGDLLDETK